MAQWLKGAKEFIWIGSVIAAVILWIITSIDASAERVEERVKLYVDQRHEPVVKSLDKMYQTLEKIDERTIKIIKEMKQ